MSETGGRLAGEAARMVRAPALWPLLALVLLVAFNAAFTPGFAAIEVRDGRLYGAMVDVLENGSLVMLAAAGMTLVIAAGGIDLSVGSVMALAGVIAALGVAEGGWSAPVAVAAGLAGAAAAGAWNGALVTFVGLQPIVATLATLVAGRGLAQALSDDQKVRFDAPGLEWLGSGTVAGLPAAAVIALGVALVLSALVRWSALGMYIEAIGGNPRAAALCGLPVRGVRLGVYTIAGACAGMAGLIAAADIREADVASAGLYMELDAILAVVIGGTSLTGGKPRLAGAMLGALLMQTLTVMLQMQGVPTERTLVIKALVVLGVVWVQSPSFAATARRLMPRRAA